MDGTGGGVGVRGGMLPKETYHVSGVAVRKDQQTELERHCQVSDSVRVSGECLSGPERVLSSQNGTR